MNEAYEKLCPLAHCECVEEDCAWWKQDACMCAILNLAARITYISELVDCAINSEKTYKHERARARNDLKSEISRVRKD